MTRGGYVLERPFGDTAHGSAGVQRLECFNYIAKQSNTGRANRRLTAVRAEGQIYGFDVMVTSQM